MTVWLLAGTHGGLARGTFEVPDAVQATSTPLSAGLAHMQ